MIVRRVEGDRCRGAGRGGASSVRGGRVGVLYTWPGPTLGQLYFDKVQFSVLGKSLKTPEFKLFLVVGPRFCFMLGGCCWSRITTLVSATTPTPHLPSEEFPD